MALKPSEEIKEKSCIPSPPTNINSRILTELFRGFLEPHCSNYVVTRQGFVAEVQEMQSQEFISP